MNKTILVGTRKGLFIERNSSSWNNHTAFIGDMVIRDRGETLQRLDRGHFGSKMHRSDDGGKDLGECAAPLPRGRPEGKLGDPVFRKVDDAQKVWALESIGDTVWCGTIPGGVHLKDDGTSWERCAGSGTSRTQKWGGGGMRWPGSIRSRPIRATRADLRGHFHRRRLAHGRRRQDLGSAL